jgi:hypothetical protein
MLYAKTKKRTAARETAYMAHFLFGKWCIYFENCRIDNMFEYEIHERKKKLNNILNQMRVKSETKFSEGIEEYYDWKLKPKSINIKNFF